MKVRESQKFWTPKHKTEIFNSRASGVVAKEQELIWGGNKKKGKENGGIEVWKGGLGAERGRGACRRKQKGFRGWKSQLVEYKSKKANFWTKEVLT